MNGMSPRALGFAVVVAIVLCSAPATADKQVVFRHPVDGPAFEKAAAFIGSYLEPGDYLDRARRDRIVGGQNPDPAEALAHYVRKYVLFGTGDIDDDGVDERFYILDEPLVWCGSAGCLMLIVRDKNGEQALLCSTSGVKENVRIADWISEGSDRRDIQAAFRVYWRDGRCHQDDPDIKGARTAMGEPPPPGRRWKPIR